ncbi:MAG: VRR-NUC domain-containing protein [Solibacillus sp.]
MRINAGQFWQGERVHSREFGQDVLMNIRPVVGAIDGFSDLLYIGNNEVAFIEVKNATGQLRKSQEAFLKRVQELGHKAGVARSVEEAIEIISESEQG